jgi:hypothetical protein
VSWAIGAAEPVISSSEFQATASDWPELRTDVGTWEGWSKDRSEGWDIDLDVVGDDAVADTDADSDTGSAGEDVDPDLEPEPEAITLCELFSDDWAVLLDSGVDPAVADLGGSDPASAAANPRHPELP